LLHELFPCPERDGPRLLVGGLRLHEPHGRPHRCFNNGLGIGGVILLALDERLDVVRRDQPNLMALLHHLPRPMVGAGASLHHHTTRRLLRHEPRELWPRQLLAEQRGPVRRSAMHLEHVLCEIDADDDSFFHGCSTLQLVLQHRKFGTLRCRQGRAASTPSSAPNTFKKLRVGVSIGIYNSLA